MYNKMQLLHQKMAKFHCGALLTTLLFFLTLCYVVTLCLSGVYQVEITADTQKTGDWKLFYSVGLTHPKFSGKRSSNVKKLQAGKKQTLIFAEDNHPAAWLRIDPGNEPGQARIYDLTVKRKYTHDRVFTASEIYADFQVGHPGMTMTMGDGFVEVTSTSEDPFLVSTLPILPRHNLGFMVVPIFIFSLYLFRILANISWEQLKSFFSVTRENASPGTVIGVLDGLRGMAALMVIADHTWPRFVGVGASGVLIFFALSGFLLARPFVCKPGKIFAKGFLLEYGARRLKRILPMYYVYLLLVYVMSLQLGNALLHAVFFKGEGHLWAIPQEMLFYMIFPGIALFCAVVCRGKLVLVLPFLALTVFLSNQFLGIDVFYLYGMNTQPLPFYLGVFASGCFCAYLYFGWAARKSPARQVPGGVVTVLSFGIVCFFWFFSNGTLLADNVIFAQQYYGIYGIAAALLILLLLLAPESSASRMFSWSVFRIIGVVGYSLYLIHPLVLNIILAVNDYFFNIILAGYMLFIVTFLLSFPVAIVCYRYIELPFLVRQKR